MVENGIGPAAAAPEAARTLTPLEVAENELTRLEGVRASLRSRGYTSIFPDMQRTERDIAQAQESVKRLKAATPPPNPNPAPRPVVPATQAAAQVEAGDDPAVAQLKANLAANRMEIDSLSADEKRLKGQIAQYEVRINETPIREQEQSSIVRDTESLRQQYAELQKKEQESQLATNLEKQQGGQQFRLIDPASLPSVPDSPNRLNISLGGAAGGLCLGLVLALLMEKRDTSYYVEKDVIRHLGPPFVLGVPTVFTAKEERRRAWRLRIEWLAATAMIMVVAAAEFYVYRHR
jgi:hypothetical protein